MALLDPLDADRTRPPGARRRRAMSLAASAGLHGAALAWLALGSPEKARTLYEQEIAPHRDRIVWYNLRDRLPEVSPAEPAEAAPPKIEVKRDQTIVSSAPDGRKGDQTIWLPEPSLRQETSLPSPNLLAFARPEERPVREFEAPAERTIEAEPRQLPEAPELAASIRAPEGGLPGPARPTREFVVPARPAESRAPAAAMPDAPEVAATALPAPAGLPAPARPQPRAFTPPTPRPAPQPSGLPAAPELASTALPAPAGLPGPARPRPRLFAPPRPREPETAAAGLPAAPEMAAAASLQAIPGALAGPAARPTRDFVAAPRAARPAPTMPDAPQLAATALPAPAGLPVPARPRPRAFVPRDPVPAALPAVLPPPGPETALTARSLPSAAIVGLNPAPTTEVPRPVGSRQVEFSAGPRPRAEGGGPATAPGALIRAPGLLVRDGPRDAEPTLVARIIEPPTSARNLAAATRSSPPRGAAAPPEQPEPPRAVRVSSAPDPRLEGRVVYSIAVQMPNVTSYSGSWILWFAERRQNAGAAPDMRPPLPLRKVDPKYFPAAMDERVEGRVRLAAVIRRTGRVEEVALLQGLDSRLDRSAAEALTRWEFEPALRNGVPVDVDAVVEIPFHLAPRTAK